jgi:hypothetical protein
MKQTTDRIDVDYLLVRLIDVFEIDCSGIERIFEVGWSVGNEAEYRLQ